MNLRKTMLLLVAAVVLFSMEATSQSLDMYTIGGFEGSLPSLLEYWESTHELDIDMGDGPIPFAGTLAEDHKNSDERYGRLGIEQHVRYLVANDTGKRGHSSWCIREDLGSEHEPVDG